VPALSTLLPTGDSAVGSWTTDSGGTSNLWQKIEEGIAGATDTTDYIKGPNDVDASDYKFALTDTPASFNSIKSLSWQVRFALSGTPPASNKDTYGLSIRIVNGATILAAADSSGTFQVIVSTTTMSTSFSNSAVTAFTYVNTSASKATWDGAIVELRQTYTQTASKDAHAVEVSAIEFTGTYNAILTASAASFTETGITATLKAARVITATVGAYTETGSTATLSKGVRLTSATGSFNETGNAATLKTSRTLSASAGSFTETGISAALKSARLLTAGLGTFNETGNNATLSKGFNFSVTSGSVAASANAASLKATRLLSASVSSSIATGNDAALLAARSLRAVLGTLTQTGNDANLISTRRTSAGSGSVAIDGSPAPLIAVRALSASLGVFLQSGLDATLLPARKLITVTQGYAVTVNAASLSIGVASSPHLNAQTGVFSVVGNNDWMAHRASLAFVSTVDGGRPSITVEAEHTRISVTVKPGAKRISA